MEPFDADLTMNLLRLLPSFPAAKAIIRAARRYSLAMENIEQQPEVSYQHLISAVETLAGNVELQWTPAEQDKLKLTSSQKVLALAKSKGLDPETAKSLALAAAEHAGWSGERFSAFILENFQHEEMKGDDRLFCIPSDFCPAVEDYQSSLKKIYGMRGKSGHQGHPYPDSALIGTSPQMPAKAFREIMGGGGPHPSRHEDHWQPGCGFLRARLGMAAGQSAQRGIGEGRGHVGLPRRRREGETAWHAGA
jgi:hypothetical protein